MGTVAAISYTPPRYCAIATARARRHASGIVPEAEAVSLTIPVRRRRARGFSLVELCTTLAVAAMLIALGLPSLGAVLDASRVRAASHSLTTALALARTHAITQHTWTVACPSADLAQCSDSASWTQGWIVFADPDRDDRRDADEALAGAERPDVGGNVRVSSSDGRRRVRFQPNGSAGGSNLTLVVCVESQPPSGRRIVMNNAGRVRVEPRLPAGAACP